MSKVYHPSRDGFSCLPSPPRAIASCKTSVVLVNNCGSCTELTQLDESTSRQEHNYQNKASPTLFLPCSGFEMSSSRYSEIDPKTLNNPRCLGQVSYLSFNCPRPNRDMKPSCFKRPRVGTPLGQSYAVFSVSSVDSEDDLTDGDEDFYESDSQSDAGSESDDEIEAILRTEENDGEIFELAD